MNAVRADLEKEEDIERLQAQRFHREEITGQQLLVLAQESSPGAALPGTQRSSRNSVPFEHSSDGRAPNTVAELEQLSFDFAVAPAGFYLAKRTISASSSTAIRGLPITCRWGKVHVCRTKSRCQRSTVSGLNRSRLWLSRAREFVAP